MWLEGALVVGFVVASLLALLAVRRRVPLEALQEQHDVAAACFAVIGGLCGIVVAFVMVSSWERFEEARERTEVEADALADLYRHGAALPDPGGARLRELTLAYARSVVEDEWPAMVEGQPSEKTYGIFRELWRTLLATNASEAKDVAVFQNTLGKMDDLSDARRDRLTYARVGLPWIVWAFLIGSGAVTVAFSYFFGLRQIASQLIMTAALALTIAAALLLIAAMQTPFTGAVQVPPHGFSRLLQSTHEEAR